MHTIAKNCLTTRLEAATSRLEDIASSVGNQDANTNGTLPAIASPTTLAIADKSPSREATPKQLPEPLPLAIEGFDALINGEVTAFVNLSEGLGGLIAEQVWLFGSPT
jgi:adenylyl cyclase-associated protein